jgi:exosortase A
MKIETETLMQRDSSIAFPASDAPGWRLALPLIVLAIVAILAAYWRTAMSIVDIWSRSETFAHGYLIAPISIVLIWNRRKEIAKLAPRSDWLGLVILALAGLVWLAGAAGQVQIVRQYAMVAMIPAAVIAVAGRHVARALMFPLAFLFLGVPIGEALIPPLMDWTADFTVALLRITGIPVYREGTFFTIPSGNWSVVEGCSGLRYLIASITVGTLYAYLNYRATRKRIIFVVLSIIVPIIANGLRAYMIVMIAHLSDMKLALGVDHLIYGWVFFGVVMILLFWAGSFWRDDDVAPQKTSTDSVAVVPSLPEQRVKTMGATLAAIAVAAAWPLYAAHLDAVGSLPVRLEAPAQAQGWTRESQVITTWRPRYEGTATSVFETYRKDGKTVALYLGYYRQQRQGAELVTSTNIMVVQKHPEWSNVGESTRNEDIGKGARTVRQTLLRSAGQRLLVWDWMRISGHDTINRYLAKLYLARDRLLGDNDDGVEIILATPYEDQPDAAAETLRKFARDMAPSIDAALTAAATSGGASAR